MNKVIIGLILVVVAFAASYLYHQSEVIKFEDRIEFLEKRSEILEAERDRLAGQLAEVRVGELDELQSTARDEIMQQIAEIRDLQFIEEVNFKVLARADLPALIEGKIDELFTADQLANLSETYAAIGLLPEGFDIKAAYTELFTEQVAAFYDQHADQLYMFEGKRLDDAINRMILAHELVHALQDQHYALEKLPLEDITNDDRTIAASSLIEGDATVAMTLFLTDDMQADEIFSALAGGIFSQSMDALNEAPVFLRETLLFPYVQGQQFALDLYARGGMQAIDDAFQRIPNSTRQILHPREYANNPEFTPVVVEWGELPDGQQLIGVNVLGEFGMRVLLGQWLDTSTAEDAAQGWHGDGYRVTRSAAGRHLELRTHWDDEQEAGEFAKAIAAALSKRYQVEGDLMGESSWQATTDSRQLEVRLTGHQVTVLDQPKS